MNTASDIITERFTVLLATPSATVELAQAMGYAWGRNDANKRPFVNIDGPASPYVDPVTFAVTYVDATTPCTLQDCYLAMLDAPAAATTAADEWTDVEVCSDCLIWHANGDDSGFCNCSDETHADDAHCHAVHFNDVTELHSSSDDEYFAWRDCDVCGALPGMRTDAKARHDA